MPEYRRDRRSGGFGGGGRGGGNFNRGSRRPDFKKPVQMFSTVCASCHKNCEVPFRPSGDKPVYCNDCFRANDGRDNNRRDDRKSFDRPQNVENKYIDEIKKQLDLINQKLDKIIGNKEEKKEDKKEKEEKPAKTPKKKTVSKKK